MGKFDLKGFLAEQKINKTFISEDKEQIINGIQVNMKTMNNALKQAEKAASLVGKLASKEEYRDITADYFSGHEAEELFGKLKDIFNAFMTGDPSNTDQEDTFFKEAKVNEQEGELDYPAFADAVDAGFGYIHKDSIGRQAGDFYDRDLSEEELGELVKILEARNLVTHSNEESDERYSDTLN